MMDDCAWQSERSEREDKLERSESVLRRSPNIPRAKLDYGNCRVRPVGGTTLGDAAGNSQSSEVNKSFIFLESVIGDAVGKVTEASDQRREINLQLKLRRNDDF